MIRVSYRRTGKSVNATIDLPPGISGVVAWKGIHYDLHAGTQQLTLP
jgi:hypothetical protein